ncbi:GNAT family N-acetyltransferase [Microbulbifer spongiae]|uniref:GNAT family N-acetyltransferase n=1 Tax=Microbulbifer spongiae TaxID=2944933 RepID=A0ABY9ED93_9GAMM|nr:GNAT family N-acetyltransferase [Microbulbifer sp. MI-G]WKD49499.1 GNAT family N-acetyltransferase [Microbulbifer sp. MI-G]
MKYSLSAKNLVCRNLETYASYKAGLISPDHTREITGLVRSDSGLLSGSLNQVVSNTVMPPRILQRFAVDYFAERHSPFTLWHSATKPLDDRALVELGLHRKPSQVAMAAEVQFLTPDSVLAPELRGRLTFSQAKKEDLSDYAQVQAAGCGSTREAAQLNKFYGALVDIPEQRRARLRFFLARLDGCAAAAGCLFASADALGVYDLFTLEDYRGQGVGRALFCHLLQQAQASHHRSLVALVPADRQQLPLDCGFFAVGEVACYLYRP